MTTKRPATKVATDSAATAMLLAKLMSSAAPERALEAAYRAGLAPEHFAGATAQAVYRKALAGTLGEPLRAACLEAGLHVGGFLVAEEAEEYRYQTASCPGRWAGQILREATRREVAKVCAEMPAAEDSALATHARKLLALAESSQGVGSDMLPASKAYARFTEQLAKPTHGVRTGFRQLDGMLGVLRPGELTVIAARTSVGKSKLAINIAHNVAELGATVHFFSLEMPAEQVAARLWSVETTFAVPESGSMLGLNMGAASSGYSNGDRVIVCDTPRLSAADIGSRVRFALPRPQLVIVDYIGLMKHERGKSDTEAYGIGESCKLLRAYARELGFHLVLLAQVNRAGAEDDAPQLHHIRGSGDIEQDAEFILLLSRVGKGDRTVVNVAKNRCTGRTGQVTLESVGASCAMVER